jgi:hypothetical protein
MLATVRGPPTGRAMQIPVELVGVPVTPRAWSVPVAPRARRRFARALPVALRGRLAGVAVADVSDGVCDTGRECYLPMASWHYHGERRDVYMC